MGFLVSFLGRAAALSAAVWTPALVQQPVGARFNLTGEFDTDEKGLVCCIRLLIYNKSDPLVSII